MARPCGAVLVAASVLAAAASENLSSRTSRSTPEGLQLRHALQDAVGGAQRIAAVRDFEETIRAEAWDASGGSLGEVRKRTRWMRTPNVVRLDQRGPRGTYVLYFDGGATSGWEILPDLTSPDRYKTTGKAIALAGGELEFAKRYLSGFELDQWLADRTPGFTVTSPRPRVLRIEHDGKASDLTLDPRTNLPLTSAGISLADSDHPVPGDMRYLEWKDVSGVRFPVGPRPQELAAKPAGSAPDLPGRQRNPFVCHGCFRGPAPAAIASRPHDAPAPPGA